MKVGSALRKLLLQAGGEAPSSAGEASSEAPSGTWDAQQ